MPETATTEERISFLHARITFLANYASVFTGTVMEASGNLDAFIGIVSEIDAPEGLEGGGLEGWRYQQEEILKSLRQLRE